MINGPDEFRSACNVSRETLDRLIVYAEVLQKWNKKINLVAPSTLGEVWRRHMLDSAQIVGLAPTSASHWADLGSGGGFPGVVVAILLSERQPQCRVTLVESDQRKAAFLRTVGRETGVAFEVLANRIESVEPMGADVVSARALAPLSDLLGFATRHLSVGGSALFLKGEKAEKEISDASHAWHFECERHRSLTDTSAVVLKIGDIKRA